MNAHYDYRPPMGPGWLVVKQAALITVGVLIGILGLLFGAFMLIGCVVVAATGTGATGGAELLGFGAPIAGVGICVLFVWLATRLKNSRV